MGELINDLLALSRLGRQRLNVTPVAPYALVEECLEELSDQREGREIDIVIGDLPNCVGDPALLKQVFLNLLSNAMKYTRRCEKARIEIGCLRSTGSGERNVYYVRDNGAGFDSRYAGKLFGVFQRLHSQSEYEGTGVGLAIVDRIIRRHGGEVWAEAKVNEGARFYFVLGYPATDEIAAEVSRPESRSVPLRAHTTAG
jgi:light-regulated signal transduction histidine kinase (bacteriophytochrome)